MNKKTLFIMTGLLILIVTMGILLLLNRQNPPTEELGNVYRAEGLLNLPTAQQTETVELADGDTFDLTAGFVQKQINGKIMKMLAYNGSIPGPLVKVKQGSEVTINFTNNADVNSTIHSHGVRMENQFDGTPDLTQDPVKPGESFTYKLKFPDAGIFWYHPHIREDYAQELGLYGNFLVEPNDSDYWNPVNREEVLILDDILIENGTIARFDQDTVNHTLMGRFGNVMLVNGEEDFRLEVGANEIVRFYLTNAANTRTFNVFLKNVIASQTKPASPDGSQGGQSPNVKLKLVGNDNGKYEHETFVDNVILGPSERGVVEVYFEQPGEYQLEHRTPERSYPMATIVVSVKPGAIDPALPARVALLRVNKDTVASMATLRNDFNKLADKSLKLAVVMKSPMGMMSSNSDQHSMHGGMMPVRRSLDEGGMDNQMMQMGAPQPIEWEDDMGAMNRNSTKDTLVWSLTDAVTDKSNVKIDDWKFKVRDKVKIKIFNDPKSMHPMQHPIHIHGQRFLVLSTNGVKNINLVWKDTALIRTGDTVEFLVEMSNPGTWMIHCHIAEHLEAGMMMKFEVD